VKESRKAMWWSHKDCHGNFVYISS